MRGNGTLKIIGPIVVIIVMAVSILLNFIQISYRREIRDIKPKVEANTAFRNQAAETLRYIQRDIGEIKDLLSRQME